MRSNSARTCPSSRVPLRAAGLKRLLAAAGGALRLPQELHEGYLLVPGQVPVRRHRRGGVLQRALDRGGIQALADVGQLRGGPVVAVLADLVAGQAARLGGDELARLVLAGDLEVDLVRRAGRRAEVGQVAHRDDGEDAGGGGDGESTRLKSSHRQYLVCRLLPEK